ncbi:hypothetical protein EHW67_05605 [Arenibacter aquaticus]|uniref:Uncharacterized protein n=1 Tax=Arenibacter aquaticus TaxID=2489054 RepID=A0A430K6I1_9FLAO|nr:hypothetical protein [Arenibacter aquaticus]RTE54642.1 hypothetical protein EHW67_05605 [Arenibacter aquaticus]
MKKALLITAFSFFFMGCNINPSKEGRIRKLETEMLKVMNEIEMLQSRIQFLEVINKELNTRIKELEQ